MNITDIPADIRDALKSLPWAENGVLWGFRYERNLMWNHSHILPLNMAQQQGIVQQDGGNYILRHDGAGIDPVPATLPGIGQPVLQIHRSKSIIRTSRVSRVVINSNFPILELVPFGPAAGIPIGGDSGSIFFMRDATGKPVVLGQAIHEGWLSFGRPGARPQAPALSEEESIQAMEDILAGSWTGVPSVPSVPSPGPSGPASAPANPTQDDTVVELQARINELVTENSVLKAELSNARADLAATSARLDTLITARNTFLNA